MYFNKKILLKFLFIFLRFIHGPPVFSIPGNEAFYGSHGQGLANSARIGPDTGARVQELSLAIEL